MGLTSPTSSPKVNARSLSCSEFPWPRSHLPRTSFGCTTPTPKRMTTSLVVWRPNFSHSTCRHAYGWGRSGTGGGHGNAYSVILNVRFSMIRGHALALCPTRLCPAAGTATRTIAGLLRHGDRTSALSAPYLKPTGRPAPSSRPHPILLMRTPRTRASQSSGCRRP